MSTNLLHFRPNLIGACAVRNPRPDPSRRKSSSSNWWTPLFGWSSEPDYIDGDATSKSQLESETRSESVSQPKPARSRHAPGCFTEEKAKQLRLMTKETETFHDAMYHSAIANRLASDFKNRSDL